MSKKWTLTVEIDDELGEHNARTVTDAAWFSLGQRLTVISIKTTPKES